MRKIKVLLVTILTISCSVVFSQWNLNTNSVLYRQANSDQIILKTSRTDNTFPGNIKTDGWGNFGFNRNIYLGGYISKINNGTEIIYRTIRTDNTWEGTITSDGFGNFGFNRNIKIGGYISNVNNNPKIIYKTIRTDNTYEGNIKTDGWGNFTFSNNVAIGTGNARNYKLNVCGTIRASEVKVDLTGCDFVFEDDYQLRTLKEVDDFIKANKRLPNVKSAAEMEADGTNLGELNSQLLQKIEELTLYSIDQEKKIERLERVVEQLMENRTCN
nr:hypothetical protein [uncultured Draconibacterium sp.]